MDRSKGRGGKSGKGHLPFPSDLIPLGKAKGASSGGESSDSKKPAAALAPSKPSSSGINKASSASSHSKSGNERKREVGSSSSSSSGVILPPTKKIRVQEPSSSSSSSSTSNSPLGTPSKNPPPAAQKLFGTSSKPKREAEEIPMDFEGQSMTGDYFLQTLEKAEKSDDSEAVQALLMGSLKGLKQAKTKPDIHLCYGLMVAAKSKARFLRSPSSVEVMCSLGMTKRPGPDLKKVDTYHPIFVAPVATSMIVYSHWEISTWPTVFVKMWLEDAAYDRYWVDRPECKEFVDTLTHSFGTVAPQPALLPAPEGPTVSTPDSGPPSSEEMGFREELAEMIETNRSDKRMKIGGEMKARFSGSETAIETMIVDFAKDLIIRKTTDLPKNLLRALAAASGLPAVRALILTKLEQWLHNPKLSRNAQELLVYLCINAKHNTPADAETVVQISKFRLKTKQLIQHFSVAIREMVRDDDVNLRNVITQVVYNELSLTKNSTNFSVLATLFSAYPSARTALADTFIELLQKREDFLSALKQILREIVRACRPDCSLVVFVQGMLANREFHWREGEYRERTFKNIADFVLISMFLSFTPTVREATISRSEKNVTILKNFYAQLVEMQENALSWLYSTAMKQFRPSKFDYVAVLNKLILKDPATDLQNKDGWPSESDRNMFARHCLELPLLEPGFIWVLFQAFSKDHNYFTQMEVLDITESLVMKGALHAGRVELNRLDLIDYFFKLVEYRSPENTILPQGYTPPNVGITKSYWRVWIILCIIAAFNPTTIGKKVWETLPTLKALMEMCMTNLFSFPTATSSESMDEVVARELQVAAIEKEQILEFESYLAAASKATITERNSLLLPQVITMDPYGTPRTPPNAVLMQLKTLNDQLRLGNRFCRSRNPDFLVDLMQRNSQPMPWLSDLVSEGSFEILPVQSLCEFMMGQTEKLVKLVNSEAEYAEQMSSGDKSSKRGKSYHPPDMSKEESRGMQLLHYLQNIVCGTSEDRATEVIEFYFRRLSAPRTQSRSQAVQALQLLFSPPKKRLDENWLLDSIPSLPVFTEVQETLTACLRQAVQVESEPTAITRYLEFLSLWGFVEADTVLDNLALDVTQLVVERSVVIQALLKHKPEVFHYLFDIYLNHMQKIREPMKDTHQWSESHEQVLVQWPEASLEATMNILIIHAIVILITSYVTSSSTSSKDKSRVEQRAVTTDLKYNELLDMWFPKQKMYAPKGLFLNTTEEAQLFPDWIKLRLIRSNNPRLVAAASEDLEIEQLILFVQSFGIPIQSMTGLLYCLDKAVEENPGKVTAVIMDAKYMIALIELQWKRGASGGHKFAGLLKRLLPSDYQEETHKSIVPKKFNPRPPLILPAAVEKSQTKPILLGFSTSNSESNNSPKSLKYDQPEDMDTSTSTSEDMNIRSLSKQLLALSSPSARRRSSVPLIDDSVSFVPRRHSVHQEKKSSNGAGTIAGNNVGQLVDTIRDVEPCIVRNALDIQLPLLFGRNDTPPHCRAFLLTVLTHEAGWKTVEECINLFLGEFVPSYDPSAILDLIASTISNPKLWQGLDKYVPKHQPQLSVFNLTESQLLVMAEYIVEEISQLEMKNTKFSISNLLGSPQSTLPKNGKKTKHCLEERVQLWLKCCYQDKLLVDSVMSKLVQKKSRNPCTKRLVSQVYLEFPEVILAESWKARPEELTSGDENVSCVLDSVSNILINAVANVQPGKDWAKKVSHESELCLRKIASIHPTLLMRQVPLMGTLLEGRVHLEFPVFSQLNHQVPFKVFLGLFDLMQPYIFKQFKILKPILTLYMQFFENFGHLKDFSMTLSRYTVLLHNLLCTNPKEMKEFLSIHYGTLKYLSTEKFYTELGPLQNLITSLVPPSESSELSILTQNGSEMDPFNMSSAQSTAIFERLQHSSNNDERASVMQELDSLSTRNPAVLSQFSDHLNPLLLSEHETCRFFAFSLMLKHMTYSPTANRMYLKSVLQALQSQGAQMIETLIERLPEFVVLAQENADVLLSQMFDLGLSSSISMLPSIIKSLALLRSQSGS